MTQIKICCIRSVEDAELAIREGANALGLVSNMPSGPGVISEEQIAAIANHVQKRAKTFLLTSLQSARAIVEQHRRCGTTTLQIVDELRDGTYDDIRASLAGIEIVQVVHVRDARSVEYALRAAPFVDALLLDSGNPGLAVKELGGTGRTHDWQTSRIIVENSPVPVWLAGGLHAGNVAEAVRIVRPHGVDICSGVREHNELSDSRLRAFVQAVAQATID